jgi:glycosyltransferase involved in cell wall biosynthesis
VWHDAALDTMGSAFAALHLGEATQLVNFPKWTPLVLRLRERFGWPIVYDCLDDQQAFGALHTGNVPELEPELIRESALLITSGRTLYDRHRPNHPNAILIENAADFELFANARPSGQFDRLPHPVIGFFGAFSEWLDLDWIAESARRFPEWSFVYIGREGFASVDARKAWQRAVSAPNIHVLGQVDLRTLAGYLAEFDVCTMPFRDLPITRSMNAVKIFEYLAAGKPVVAPDLPETNPLAGRGLISVYQSSEESFQLLREAAAAGPRDGLAQARRRFASENTWRMRRDDLTNAIESCRRDRPSR